MITTKAEMQDGVQSLLGAALALQEGRVEDAKFLLDKSPNVDPDDWFWVGAVMARDMGRLLATLTEKDPVVVLDQLALDTALQSANRECPEEEQ